MSGSSIKKIDELFDAQWTDNHAELRLLIPHARAEHRALAENTILTIGSDDRDLILFQQMPPAAKLDTLDDDGEVVREDPLETHH